MNNPMGLLFATALVLFWLIPAAAWLMVRDRSDPAARLWFGATVFGALATTVFIARMVIPEWIANLLSSLCINCTVLLMGESLKREYQKNAHLPIGLFSGVLGGQLLLNLALITGERQELLPVFNVSIVSILDIWLIYRLIRVMRLTSSRSLWVVLAAVLLVLMTNLLRIAEFTHTGIWPTLLHFSVASNLGFIANFISVVFYTFGYWGLVIEKEHAAVLLSREETLRARNDEDIALTQNRVYATLLKERNELIEKLARVQKFAKANALSASIAHELNQPLTAIRIDAQEALLSLQEFKDLPRTEVLLQKIIHHNTHAARVIRTVRSIFSRQSPQKEDRDLDEIVRSVLSFVQAQTSELGIEIQTNLNAMVKVQVGAGEVEHVLLNLCINAADAMRFSVIKNIHISTSIRQGMAHIEITDTGPGVPAAQQSEIFNLLRSDKADGLGLGLWLSRYIVEKHGGNIELGPSATGARFLIKLPLSSHVTPQPMNG